jgi:uncharacterized protein
MLTAAVLGLVIGAVMGGFGAGGSVLTVPALIYLLGQQPHTATTASLVVVGLTSLVSAFPHARRGMVRWRQGLLFGTLGSAGALLGTRLAVGIDQDLLLLAFAGLILVAAVAMVKQQGPDGDDLHGPSDGPGHGVSPAGAGRRALRIVPAAVGLGVLTGIFGVGGGFAVVPTLVLVLGTAMPQAVGTSLVITAVNSGSALIARVGTPVELNWSIMVPFAVFAVLGAVPSAWLTHRLPVRTLTRGFAVLLVVVALGVGTAAVRSLV